MCTDADIGVRAGWVGFCGRGSRGGGDVGVVWGAVRELGGEGEREREEEARV